MLSKQLALGVLLGVLAATVLHRVMTNTPSRESATGAASSPSKDATTTGTTNIGARDGHDLARSQTRGTDSSRDVYSVSDDHTALADESQAQSVIEMHRSKGHSSAISDTDTLPNEGIVTTIILSQAQLDRSAESKDVAWSYHMEQALRQFIGAHSDTALFDIANIDCRMTFCEIHALAFDRSSLPNWQRIANDIHLQPWAEFDQVGTSSAQTSMGFSLSMILKRRAQGP